MTTKHGIAILVTLCSLSAIAACSGGDDSLIPEGGTDGSTGSDGTMMGTDTGQQQDTGSNTDTGTKNDTGTNDAGNDGTTIKDGTILDVLQDGKLGDAVVPDVGKG